MGLWNLPSNEMEAIRFFQGYNILPSSRECANFHQMKLCPVKDNMFWKCNIRNCRQKVRLKVGTWFERSHIKYTTAIRFIYCWSKKLTSIKFCMEELEMADKTAIYWNKCLKDLCVLELKSEKNNEIGSTGRIAEINWRQMQAMKGNDCFDSILKAIATYFEPEKVGMSKKRIKRYQSPETMCAADSVKTESEDTEYSCGDVKAQNQDSTYAFVTVKTEREGNEDFRNGVKTSNEVSLTVINDVKPPSEDTVYTYDIVQAFNDDFPS